MVVNANEDQWAVKDIEEWSGVIFSQRENYGRVRMSFGTRSENHYPGHASPDLQQMTNKLPHGCTVCREFLEKGCGLISKRWPSLVESANQISQIWTG
jgi:hypothetical protein